MNDHSLEKEILRLRQEKRLLEEENKRLKEILRQNKIVVKQKKKKLSKEQKIQIFMDYFKGREDVFEVRYFSQKKQSYGWALACDLAFDKRRCLRGKIPKACSICRNKQFTPFSKEILTSHFTGINIDYSENYGIGIFPLLSDNTCYFLAMDFDDKNWFENLYCVYQVAKEKGLDALMERSASGEGGHLWLFFEEAIKASLARKLGDTLLQEAIKKNSKLSFASFDRMFPNQDFVPEGGFGNQIALPLRHDDYIRGNSAFIDENQNVLHDPIQLLASIKKISFHQIELILSQYNEPDYFLDGNQMRFNFHLQENLVRDLYMIQSNMLKIEKRNLNSTTYNILRRIGSMYNPAYRKLQSLHKPIYYKNTPRILCFYEEDDSYLYLPRGTLEKIRSIFVETTFHIEDQRVNGYPLSVQFKGELYPSQKKAADQLMRYEMGIFKARPGFGKTVVGIYILSQFQVSTLIIVHTKDLQKQWKKRLEDFLIVPQRTKKKDSYICLYNGNSKQLNHHIDVATAASLTRTEDLEAILDEYGLILVDECHRAASDTFTHILRNARSKRIYGLSATPNRQDQLDKVVNMFCGKIRYEVQSRDQDHIFEKFLIPRMTNSRILDEEMNFTQICSGLVKDMARNKLIFEDVIKEFENYSKIILLSERKEHLKLLYEMFLHVTDQVYLLTGEMKNKDRNQVMEEIRSMDSSDRFILLATSKLLGEGFDLPSLNTLFLIMPISDKNRIIQYTGRIERNDIGKEIVTVYDYLDVQIPMMQSMYYKRLKQYEKEGYRIKESQEEVAIHQVLYDKEQALSILKIDLEQSKREIVFFCTQVILSKVKQAFTQLQNEYSKGIKIYFVLSEKYKEKQEILNYLRGLGGRVLFSDHNKHFVIIDRKIVWNGNFDVFGYPKSDSYAIRILDSTLIDEVLQELDPPKNKEQNSQEITLF